MIYFLCISIWRQPPKFEPLRGLNEYGKNLRGERSLIEQEKGKEEWKKREGKKVGGHSKKCFQCLGILEKRRKKGERKKKCWGDGGPLLVDEQCRGI